MTVTGYSPSVFSLDENRLFSFDLRPDWLVDFESCPVIIATDVTIAKAK